MRPDAAGALRRPPGWKHQHSPTQVLVATVAMVAVFAAPLIAASYPLATVAVAGGAVAVAATRRVLGRRPSGETAEVCGPRADRCANA